nr:MAG TPA: hypothetical protein [Caudoviricetes sp.]
MVFFRLNIDYLGLEPKQTTWLVETYVLLKL